MTILCYKKMDTCPKLSEQLQTARLKFKKSLPEISDTTHIPFKYLTALESGHYQDLPLAIAHRTAYVKQYALAVNLDPKTCLKQFTRENGFGGTSTAHPHVTVRLFPFASLSILMRNLSLGLSILLFIGYLGWQVRGVLEPPKLIVFAPFEGDTSNDQSIMVQGKTDPETHLTINGQDLIATEEGNFETKIDASVGLNTITISATKKHGKTTTITRHVVVRPKQLTTAPDQKPASY